MNIRKILEGLNIDSQLINDIDSIVYIDNYNDITGVKYDGKKLNISFKSSKNVVETESSIDITFPNIESKRYMIDISIDEYISNYGKVNIEDVRNFDTYNKYKFEYDKEIGIGGYSCQHSLVELVDEPVNEELYRINQNNYNIFVLDGNNVKSYGKDTFLSVLGVQNDNVSNLDMILLARNHFINNVNNMNLLFDKDMPLSLRMK